MNKCFLCKNKSYILIKFKTKKNKIYKLNLCRDCCENFNILVNKKVHKKVEKCPFCGYSIKEFKEYRFLGCAFCYEYFYNEVMNYLNKTRINSIYKGKYPKKFRKKAKIKKFLELKDSLISEIIINGKEN